jgi:hypothetical protein
MKQLLVIFMMFTSLPVFAQWENVKMDSAVSFKLPKGYERTKSDSENNFVARTTFGTILIFKAIDNKVVTPDIERDRHLKNYYNDYIKRIESSTADGKITNEKDTLLGDLQVKDFTLEIDSGSGIQLRKFRILHANNATYTFEFLFQELHREYADEECNQFFNSIRVAENLERVDQFNSNSENKPGQRTNLLIGAGIVAVLIIALIVFFILKRKNSPSKF